MGIGSLLFTEIEAWQRLSGVRLTAWELETITDLDAAIVGQVSKTQRAKNERRSRK